MKKLCKSLFSLLLTALLAAGVIPPAGITLKTEAAYTGADGGEYRYVLVDKITSGNTYLIANAADGESTLAGAVAGSAEGGAITYASAVSTGGIIEEFEGVENFEWNLLPSRAEGTNESHSTPATYMLQNMATSAYLYNPVYDTGDGADMRITYDPLTDTYPQSTRQVFNSDAAYNAYVTTNSKGYALQEDFWLKIGRTGATDPNVYFNFRIKDSVTENGLSGYWKGGFVDHNLGVTKMGFFEFFSDGIEGREGIDLTSGYGMNYTTGYMNVTSCRQGVNTWAAENVPDFLVNWGGSGGSSGLSASTSKDLSGKTIEQLRFDIDCDSYLYISSIYLAKNDHASIALRYYRLNEAKFGENGYYPSQRFPFCQFAVSSDGTAKKIGNFDTEYDYYVQEYFYGWNGNEFIRSWNGRNLENTYFYEKQLVSDRDFIWTLVTSPDELHNGDVVMFASTDTDSKKASVFGIVKAGDVTTITSNTVKNGHLVLKSSANNTSQANRVMRVFNIGSDGEFFLFATHRARYLRSEPGQNGFGSWKQMCEGGASGGDYCAGVRCSYNFTENRIEIKTNPQNPGEAAVTTTLGMTNGVSSVSTEGKCFIYKKEYHDHTPSDAGTITTAPTCAETGVMTYTCTDCLLTYTRELPADPANHADLTTVEAIAPTCTEGGVAAHGYCSGCGKFFTDATGAVPTTPEALTLSPLGHNYASVVTAPSCTGQGVTTYTCTRCGDSYAAPIPAAGHTPGEWTVTSGPTCTAEGRKTRSCAVCGVVLLRRVDGRYRTDDRSSRSEITPLHLLRRDHGRDRDRTALCCSPRRREQRRKDKFKRHLSFKEIYRRNLIPRRDQRDQFGRQRRWEDKHARSQRAQTPYHAGLKKDLI